jgi:hypothetical protein
MGASGPFNSVAARRAIVAEPEVVGIKPDRFDGARISLARTATDSLWMTVGSTNHVDSPPT